MSASSDAWVVGRPTPALRHLVDRYIGYRLVGHPPGVHRGLPSQHMTLIISIGPPIDVIVQADRSQLPASYRCVVGGLHAEPALIAHSGFQEGVAIELRPLASRALLGMPARALRGLSVELADVVGDLADRLWESLQPARGWGERFAACDDTLHALLRPMPIDPVMAHCWKAIVDSGGCVSVGSLAERAGWSRQHLGRRFRHEFGLSPKRAARVVRFERAARILRSPDSRSVARVAAECGYADQAHLAREVGRLAGCTPASLADDIGGPIDEEVPFVLDGPATDR